jgi:hypothetical protein
MQYNKRQPKGAKNDKETLPRYRGMLKVYTGKQGNLRGFRGLSAHRK